MPEANKAINTVLAIDTALQGISIGLVSPNIEAAVSKALPMIRGQAEHLVPEIQNALQNAGLEFEDLDAILTTYGPGAFAGLRIGLSAARALSISLDIPLYGLSTFEAVSLTYSHDHKVSSPYGIALETKRKDIYAQVFDASGTPLSAPMADMYETVQGQFETHGVKHVIGNASQHFSESYATEVIELSDMACCAEIFVQQPSHDIFVQTPEPLYLRGPDVSKSKKPQRVLEENA